MALLDWLFGRKQTERHDQELSKIDWSAIRQPPAPPQPTPQAQQTDAEWVAFDNRHHADRMRPNNLIRLSSFINLPVAGTSHRLDTCLAFIAAMHDYASIHGELPTLTITREDQPAGALPWLPIHAHLGDGRAFHLGYLPKEKVATLCDSYAAEMPLGVEMVAYGSKTDNSAVFFRINVLGPRAPERRKFEI